MNRTISKIVFGIALAIAGPVTAGEHAPASDQAEKTIKDFGAANKLAVTFDRPVTYVPHPDGGVTVRYVDGLKIVGISTAAKDRGGAMWNPGKGKLGYANWKPQGFDVAMKAKNGSDTYDASLNVAPEATGSPFDVPGEGSLVIALSGDDPKSWRVVDRYRVVNFARSLPAPGSFRAPVRGMTEPRDRWTQAAVHANLDRYFSAKRSLDGLPGLSADDAEKRLADWRASASAGVFYTAFASDEVTPAMGVNWYGRGLALSLGHALLELNNRDRSIEYRRALADALVQRGIDLYGTILDGAYFQMNGGWTYGRIWLVEFAGVMLDDPHMLNMVADPLNKPSAPGFTLEVLPFTEQRQYSPVRPEGEYYTRGTNPKVSDQMAKWGSVVGADTNETLALTPQDVGLRYWTIQNDRSYGKRSHLNSWIKRVYHSVNIQGQAWVRAAYALLEYDGHAEAFAATRGVRDGIDTSLLQWWQMMENQQRINAQGMIPNPHDFMKFGGAVLFGDWEKNPDQGIVDVNTLNKSKPGRAYAPLLTDRGDGKVAVEFNAYQPSHGHPVTRHDIRWSTDGGKTWTVIEDAEDGLVIDTGATGKTLVTVQDRLTTDAGTGTWSPTMNVKGRTFGELTIQPNP